LAAAQSGGSCPPLIVPGWAFQVGSPQCKYCVMQQLIDPISKQGDPVYLVEGHADDCPRAHRNGRKHVVLERRLLSGA
jgi:hypothetical protein